MARKGLGRLGSAQTARLAQLVALVRRRLGCAAKAAWGGAGGEVCGGGRWRNAGVHQIWCSGARFAAQKGRGGKGGIGEIEGGVGALKRWSERAARRRVEAAAAELVGVVDSGRPGRDFVRGEVREV